MRRRLLPVKAPLTGGHSGLHELVRFSILLTKRALDVACRT
jgi:hypothetical protein